MKKWQYISMISGLTLIILGLFMELKIEKQRKPVRFLPCPSNRQFLC